MGVVVCLLNLKGGVGKTSTAITSAGVLPRDRASCSLADLDPQASLTGVLRPAGDPGPPRRGDGRSPVRPTAADRRGPGEEHGVPRPRHHPRFAAPDAGQHDPAGGMGDYQHSLREAIEDLAGRTTRSSSTARPISTCAAGPP